MVMPLLEALVLDRGAEASLQEQLWLGLKRLIQRGTLRPGRPVPSSDLIKTLLAHDLVDEIDVFTFPVLLGRGKKLFNDGVHPHAYQLTRSRISPNGLIFASYVRDGEVRTGSLAQNPPHPAEVARREKLEREG